MDIDKTGVGTLIVSSSSETVLLGMRAQYKTHPFTWSLFGGMIEVGETTKIGLLRELEEEMGFVPDIAKIYPFDIYYSKDKHFKYYTYVIVVEDEFTPSLNNENCGYCWIKLGCWPKPMHQGAKASFCTEKATDRIRLILEQHRTV